MRPNFVMLLESHCRPVYLKRFLSRGRAAIGNSETICTHPRTIYCRRRGNAFWLGPTIVQGWLRALVHSGRVMEGDFRPGGIHREWCDAEVLRTIRRKSLARLRKQVEPVEQQTLARMATHWHGCLHRRRGLDAVLDAIDQLQGAPLPASVIEREILPARVVGYQASDLDTLIGAGEVVWCGVEPIGETDGRIALYLAGQYRRITHAGCYEAADGSVRKSVGEKQQQILELLASRGAMFFGALTKLLAEDSRARRSMRCGDWCGRGASRMIRFTLCAHTWRSESACEVLRGSMCNRIFDHAARWRRVRRVDGHWSILQIQLKYHRPFEATRLRYSC